MKLTKKKLDDAYEFISKEIAPSPLVLNDRLSKIYGCHIYLKLENMLPVGSFKLRGALYKMSKLSSEEKKKGVLAVSAGNHGQGVAWAAKHLKIKAVVVMPENSPLNKIESTKAFGAKVILKGQNVEESFKFAQSFNKKEKMIFVHPFEDIDVIAGQSTIAREIINKLPEVDYVFGSIGGGGLVTGIASVFKDEGLKTKIIGGQASGVLLVMN